MLTALLALAEASAQALPDPLTLAEALTFADAHPRVQAGADAELPPRPQPIFLGCHTLAFDNARPGDTERDAAWSALLPSAVAQQLEIMQRFFDVLLADLSYMRDNEAMAVAYIQFDRAENRRALGQSSPLLVAELEAAYQLIRRRWAASDATRRMTRSLLAQALGTPTDLPKNLVEPPPLARAAPVPALDAAVDAALDNNPRIRELRADAGEARAALVAMAVRQQALELLERLQLLGVAADQARIEADWRDLKLDQSRILYEMEVTADLGFSMSQQTKARRDLLATDFCLSLTRAQLDALQGKPIAITQPVSATTDAQPAEDAP